MIYYPEKYKKETENVNEQLMALKGTLTQKEAQTTLVKFLRHNLGFTVDNLMGIKLTPHQEIALKGMFLRDYSMNIWSRGGAKTVDYQPLTYLREKSKGMIPVTDLFPNIDFSQGDRWVEIPKVEFWNGHDWQETTKMCIQPQKPCITLKTALGFELTGSENHLIKVINKDNNIVWGRYGDLKAGDYVCISRSVGEWGKEKDLPKEEIYKIVSGGLDEIPQVILNSSNNLAFFLSNLFSNKKFITVHYTLARQVHIALSCFGIISELKSHSNKFEIDLSEVKQNPSIYPNGNIEDFFFDKIESLEHCTKDCLDWDIPNGRCYWSNGFINHNSTIAAIFCILYAIFEPNSKIMIVGPTFRTPRMIFLEIEKIVKDPKNELLKQCFSKPPSKRPDLYDWTVGTSSIRAIPLNGEKIRGFRANVLIIDEALLLSDQIIKEVLMPFLIVPKDIKAKIAKEEIRRRKIRKGELVEGEKMAGEENEKEGTGAKMIMFSSASYTFESLYTRYQKWVENIQSKEDTKATYFVSQISYEALPKFLVEQNVIEEAQSGGGNHASFMREYRAQFVDDSDGYFSVKKMLENTLPVGQYPTAMIRGAKDKKYVLSVDPNYSNSASADYFAMAVLELNEETRGFTLVHTYGKAGEDLRNHNDYLLYLLTNFNIVMMICDNNGSGEVLSFNTSASFVKSGISFSEIPDFKSNAEGSEYIQEIARIRNLYNQESRRFTIFQIFNPHSIRRMNEYLQASIDQKKLFFASPLGANDSEYESVIKLDKNIFPDGLIGKKTMSEFIHELIEDQDDGILQTRTQCALIEVSTNPNGTQKFDLPSHLKRDHKSRTRARKDNYTALLMACWAAKCYYDLMEYKPQTVVNSFLPRFIA